MTLNSKQLTVLWVGISLLMLTGLIPPWTNGNVAGLFYYPSDELDLKKLYIEWFIIAVGTGGWIFTLKNAEPKPERGVPMKAGKIAKIAPILACVLGLAMHLLGEYSKADFKAQQDKIAEQRQATAVAEQQKQYAAAQAEQERQRVMAESYQRTQQEVMKTRHSLALKLMRPRQFRAIFDEGLYASLEIAMTGDETLSYKLNLPIPQGVHFCENVTLDMNDKNGFSLIKRSFAVWSGGTRTGSFTCQPSVCQRIAQFQLEKGLSGVAE